MNQNRSEEGQGGILGLIVLFLIGVVLCYILFFVGLAVHDPIRDLLNTDFKNSDEVCGRMEITVDEGNVLTITNNSDQVLTVYYVVDWGVNPVRFDQTIEAGSYGITRGPWVSGELGDELYANIRSLEIQKLYAGDGTVYRCNLEFVQPYY